MLANDTRRRHIIYEELFLPLCVSNSCLTKSKEITPTSAINRIRKAARKRAYLMNVAHYDGFLSSRNSPAFVAYQLLQRGVFQLLRKLWFHRIPACRLTLWAELNHFENITPCCFIITLRKDIRQWWFICFQKVVPYQQWHSYKNFSLTFLIHRASERLS